MEEKRCPVTHSDEEWRKLLTPEQYDILRRRGTVLFSRVDPGAPATAVAAPPPPPPEIDGPWSRR